VNEVGVFGGGIGVPRVPPSKIICSDSARNSGGGKEVCIGDRLRIPGRDGTDLLRSVSGRVKELVLAPRNLAPKEFARAVGFIGPLDEA